MTAQGEMIVANAAEREAMFADDDWIYDRVSDSGISLSSLRPCSCGCTRFVMTTRGPAWHDHVVACEKCRLNRRYRLAKFDRDGKPMDLVYARLDVTTGILVYLRPIPEILNLRSLMGNV